MGIFHCHESPQVLSLPRSYRNTPGLTMNNKTSEADETEVQEFRSIFFVFFWGGRKKSELWKSALNVGGILNRLGDLIFFVLFQMKGIDW